MSKLADRVAKSSDKTYGMYEKAANLEAAGVDLIHLEFGRPLYDTPEHIKNAAIAALQAGKVHYSDMQGDQNLRKAISEKLGSFNKMDFSADEILITNGLTQASYSAFMALINSGDEVIVLDPFYPQHMGKIELAGGLPVSVSLDPDTQFGIRADWIERAITPRTRAIVLINPANPTGRVYTYEELDALAKVAIKHGLVVISDEVYEQITYDGHSHISIASLPGMRDRTISMFAFTKAFAMDGWRIGYLAADKSLIPGLMKITTNTVTHVNTFIQEGALAAINSSPDVVQDMVDEDCRKRDLVVRSLNQMPGIKCAAPEGTIYAFPDISGTQRTAQELADIILEEAHVVVEAGSFYGSRGQGHLRLCFGSQTYSKLEEALGRISSVINNLK